MALHRLPNLAFYFIALLSSFVFSYGRSRIRIFSLSISGFTLSHFGSYVRFFLRLTYLGPSRILMAISMLVVKFQMLANLFGVAQSPRGLCP